MTVLGPPELVTAVRERSTAALAAYGDSGEMAFEYTAGEAGPA